MKNFFEKLIGVFFPKVCPCCGEILRKEEELCETCKREVVVIKAPFCNQCGKRLESGEKIICKDCKKTNHQFEQGASIFVYEGKLRKSLHQFKYENARVYADYYGEEALRACGERLLEWKPECIVPVPMYRKKEQRRGYNQAEVFGRSLAKRTGIPLCRDLLIRKKNTKPQKGLTDERRYNNLKNAFGVNREQAKQFRTILLVDDIYTTGSTMNACAGLLKKAGVEKVFFLCIASGKD
jgi:ComF family protein